MTRGAKTRPQPRTERTREALIQAGRTLFSKRPVDSVAIDDIVQEAGVAKGSFYNHFKDRDDLVKAVVAEIRMAVERGVTAANAEVEDPARRAARAVCVYLRFAIDDPERAGVLVRIHSGYASLDSPLNQGLVHDVSSGLATGRFTVATTEAGVLFIMGVSQAAMVRVAREPSAPLGISLGQQMCALMLRGLGVPSAEADQIAAQAAEDIIRRGPYADASLPSGPRS